MPPRFSLHQLEGGTLIGEILQGARANRGLKLSDISRRLKVPPRYLEALEKGDWGSLPPGNYGRYFLRAYAELLQLDPAPLLAQYPTPATPAAQPVTPSKVSPLPAHRTHPLRRLVMIVGGVAVVAYLIFAASAAFLPPPLNLFSPASDASTTKPLLTVSGQTAVGSEVTINSERVEVTGAGRFSRDVPLRPGLNTITVTATKAYSRAVTVVRQVLFTPTPTP